MMDEYYNVASMYTMYFIILCVYFCTCASVWLCVCVFQNSDGEDVVLGVSSEGILLYRDDTVESKFLWPRVLNVSYKHSKFLFRTHPSEVVLTEQNYEIHCI